MSPSPSITTYRPPEVIEYPAKWLVAVDGTAGYETFLFFDRLEIGRYKKARTQPGMLMVHDQTVSSHHCVITQEPDGRCTIRDTSRNGTRVDGRRLSPNLTTALEIGQVVSVGRDLELRLDGTPPAPTDVPDEAGDAATHGLGTTTTVTVLVGDIRNYTEIVRYADPSQLQSSVNRVFERLERKVESLGGTLKEFQGDAIFSFWERGKSGCHACQASRAAIELERLARQLAADPTVWTLGAFPLQMDFALASGLVTISGYGADGAMGLSMVGETVVLAYRIEKFAGPETGPIVACSVTRQLAAEEYDFEDLGVRELKGFQSPVQLHALRGPRR
jgi:class 3 adenylate cyclase